MEVELRELKDPSLMTARVTKFCQCFEILDKLGADNCVDPDDFEEEDMEDDMFKNLQIREIEDILSGKKDSIDKTTSS